MFSLIDFVILFNYFQSKDERRMALSEKDLISSEEVITELLEQGNAGQAVVELFKIIRKLNDANF